MQATRLLSEQILVRGGLWRTSTSRQVAGASRSIFTATSQSTRASRYNSVQRHLPNILRPSKSASLRQPRLVRCKGDKPSPQPNPTPHLGSPEPALSLSQRFKKLSREYGWSAVGVYALLTALDFPFCFLAVRSLGTERVAHYEHLVLEGLSNVIRIFYPEFRKGSQSAEDADSEGSVQATAREGQVGLNEVDQADAANRGSGASIWTQLALAYAIHKAFIFVRIPATIAVTPKVVRTLRGWGWDIGKRKPKSK